MTEHVNDNQIRDYDTVLDAEFGVPGTPERIAAEEQARAFYSDHLSGKVSGIIGEGQTIGKHNRVRIRE